MQPTTFTYPISIYPGDIDQLGHVNNVTYLKWVQEAAIAHWDFLATEQMKKENIWVVIRHEIDYLRPGFLNSRLIATTWVGKSEGAKSERYVNITDLDSSKELAKVKTTWTLLDAITKRPKRVTEDLIELFR